MPQILLISSLCNDVCDVTKVRPHQGPVPCTKVIKKRMFFCLKKKVKKKFGGQTWPYLLDLRVSKVVQSSSFVISKELYKLANQTDLEF